MLITPPLSLYIHFPWCLKKCPYCDFNSHTLVTELPELSYVNALLLDLERDLKSLQDRSLISIFMGGGTPSLFSPNTLQYLLSELSKRLQFADTIEITLEANPGAVDYQHFCGYRAAGINRLSLGVQSFATEKLQCLGRIHNGDEAIAAVLAAKNTGFTHINLDLMHGLPKQTIIEGVKDLQIACSLEPAHISWYQLTIEPHTRFYQQPPLLPADETLAELQDRGEAIFKQEGYEHYEISAFSKKGAACVHNCNYWQFGDYIGIGAGAHSKLTDSKNNTIRRAWKQKNPKTYLAQQHAFLAEEKLILADDLPFEFMLNALRLHQKIPVELFQQRTGLSFSMIQPMVQQAQQQGLLTYDGLAIETTALGKRFHNNLLALFMKDTL